jgi:hypothetical protein
MTARMPLLDRQKVQSRITRSPVFRDIASLAGSNVIARIGSLALALLIARTTRSLSAVDYAFTFAALTAGQMAMSLDLGIGSLSVDLASRGGRADRVVAALKSLRQNLAKKLVLWLPLVSVAEFLILGTHRSGQQFRFDWRAALFIGVQSILVGTAIHLGVYERVLYGARFARQLSKASLTGLAFSVILLVGSLLGPKTLVPGIVIFSVFGGSIISKSARMTCAVPQVFGSYNCAESLLLGLIS